MKTYDERIIELLFEGFKERDIPEVLSNEGFKPCSLSSVEKFINKLKKQYKVETMFHLGVVLSRRRNLLK